MARGCPSTIDRTPIRRVYELLRQRGGMKPSEIARLAGFSPKTGTENILMSLENAGCLIYQEADGTVKALEPIER